MSQLTAVDTNFLHVESARTFAHIGGLGIVDPLGCPGETLTREAVVELVRQRAHLAKPMRRKLSGAPFGIDRPYWTEDTGFDPSWHVHEVGLPAPGTDLQLGEEIARLHERPLDRRRPLWELYLVQGLQGGRAALFAKVHHAAIDGVLAVELLAALLDIGPDPRQVPAPPDTAPELAPSQMAMLGTGLAKAALHPFRAARSVARTTAYLDQIPVVGQAPGADLVARAVQGVLRRDRMPRLARLSPPRAPFNGPIGARRSFAYGSLPLSDIRLARRAFGVSLNDVVMAMCATALRRWLVKRDALPDHPLVAAVPVSLRRGGTGRDGANRLSAMIAPLPTHLDDPRERFETVRDSMRTVKRRFVSASAGGWFEELCGIMPGTFSGLATRFALQLAPALVQPVNLMISNVPGPRTPLYICGARMLSYHPASVISDLTGGLNITVFSYDGSLDIGIVACPDLVPDVWELIDYLRDALEELKILADS
ncbi:MAG: acyltransferase [Streptosporangiaceae bacterium]|jgi:diacylglycerol O-acyltransferase|nr:acyltransferase [Streptosporangiaceae bacterium]